MVSGRHAQRRSPRLPRNLVPIASALAVVGVLVGGTVTAALTRPTGRVVADPATSTTSASAAASSTAPTPASPSADPARSQASERANRGEARPTTTPGAVTPSASRSTGTPTAASGGTCQASYYSDGQRTADGETYDPNAYTAAHRTLPFNTNVRVTDTANGKSVVVRINDRGPYVAGRCLDLSRAAFGAIASYSSGVITVKYEVLG